MLSSEILGSYLRGFFILRVNIDDGLPEAINTENERTFSHEFLHFFQDIGTTFGLININHCVDLIKSSVQQMLDSEGPVRLPISLDSFLPGVAANVDLFSFYNGDGAENYFNILEPVFIKNLHEDSYYLDAVRADIRYYEIEFHNNAVNGWIKKARFGAVAIKESMAHLIECKLYGDDENKGKFPYCSASAVAEFIYPSLTGNHLAVSELCESSLLYFHPAEVFIETLKMLCEANITFSNPNDYYNYVLKTFPVSGASVLSLYSKMANIAEKQVDDLFTVEPYCNEHWASNHVKRARKMRIASGSLSAELWERHSQDARQYLMNSVKDLGFPLAFNNNDEAWVELDHEHFKTPFMFPIIYTFYQIILGQKCSCYLKDYCEKESSPYKTSPECNTAPWLRNHTRDDYCLFSTIWHMWGLRGAGVEIEVTSDI